MGLLRFDMSGASTVLPFAENVLNHPALQKA